MNNEEWERLRKSLIEVEFEIDHWSDVDDLIKWMRKEVGARIVRRAIGPDARTIFTKVPAGNIDIYQLDTGDVSILGAETTKAIMDTIASRAGSLFKNVKQREPCRKLSEPD
jgi:hypothetical protein